MNILDILFYIFFLIVFIQVTFYLFVFRRFAFLKNTKETTNNLPVSIIICAKNEADNLEEFLPLIISQEYPNFEIVLINDASSDDTLKIMERFASQYPNIKVVDVKNTEAFWGNKKYALTLGIKASKYNHLLLTDADCKPLSKFWIKEMASCFNNTQTIVLGYGKYAKIKNSLLNKIVRFETLMTAIQYFSFAKIGMPYMGVGRNLAYTKEDFFRVNGFVNHIKLLSGDDDLFINEIADDKNVALCITEESFTESKPELTLKAWIKQKRRHISSAKYYKIKHKLLLSSFYISNLLFWFLAIPLIISNFNWVFVLSLFLIRLIIQYVIVYSSSKKLNEVDLLLWLPILDISLIILQFIVFVKNLISKPDFWK